jgi:hypothetical protein
MEGITMANELKKFLDAAGVGHLWGKVTEKIDTEVTKEADRAKAAEKALGDKLVGIDTTVVAYVDEKTSDIASGTEDEALAGRVGTIEKDYAKTADVASTYETKEVVKTLSDDYAGYKTSNNAALAAVKATADAAAVKTEVEAALGNKADKTYAEATEAKVAKLIGDDTNKSVRTIANEELAAQLIPESAAEALDTLEEIAAWIQAHPGDVAAINKAIKAVRRLEKRQIAYPISTIKRVGKRIGLPEKYTNMVLFWAQNLSTCTAADIFEQFSLSLADVENFATMERYKNDVLKLVALDWDVYDKK